MRGADHPTSKSQSPRAKAPPDRDFARACHDGPIAIVRHAAVFFAFAAALSLTNYKGFVREMWECAMRTILGLAFSVSALFVAGCTSIQVGPIRPITIADDVAYTRPLAEPDLSTFYSASPATQAAVRNQMLTARMYIADVQYHYYEARLTREVQEEGLAATLASLGLTTASTLVGSAATKTILSGTATAVIGADKAYNEKELLSNSIQALQTQMRADRKTQAAAIYAKMFKDTNPRTLTPIFEYTLPMALSDADAYYQAGTIASALIGLSKTVANAEHNADQAKSNAGPNPEAVSNAKVTAAPMSNQTTAPAITRVRPTVIRDVNAPLERFVVPVVQSETRLGLFESKMSSKDLKAVLVILCRPDSEKDLGPAGSPARADLNKFLTTNGKAASDRITQSVAADLTDLRFAGKRNCN